MNDFLRPIRACFAANVAAFGLVAWLLAAIAWAPIEARAQASAASQYDVEAVYLYDFAKFVRWPPESAGRDLTICIAGRDVYVDSLKKVVAGERIDTHKIAVRSILRPEDVLGCDILFIGASVAARLDGLLAATSGKPVLTVSDIPGFLDRGGMIQFLLTENRVRFSIDLRPITRNGIGLSSQLLKVAVTVRNQAADGGTP